MATVVADPLPAGLAKKQIAPYSAGVQWNRTLLDWEPEPPPPPDVDRIEEFLTRVGPGLNSAAATKVRSELVALLAELRFRDPNDTYEIKVP